MKKISITAPEAVARAKRIADLAYSKYKLGAGGRDPRAQEPWTERDGVTGSDCIGFVLWCLGLDRYQPEDFPYYGGWINTDSALSDAWGKQAFFRITDSPCVGDFVVYPSIYEGSKRKRIGHVGLIVDVTMNTKYWTSRLWGRPKYEREIFLDHVKVIDCAASWKRKLKGRAVQEVTANYAWNKPDARFVRYKHLA